MSMSSIPDADLSGLTLEQARQYVLEFIRSLKETERQSAALQQELSVWEGRMTLAREKGRADLAAQAASRVEKVRGDLAPLLVEENDLRRKIALMKENLGRVHNQFDRSVDTEQLLANLNLLVGERDETVDRIRDVEADLALDELKKKMNEGGK